MGPPVKPEDDEGFLTTQRERSVSEAAGMSGSKADGARRAPVDDRALRTPRGEVVECLAEMEHVRSVMTFEVQTLSVDFKNDTATVSLVKKAEKHNSTISINVPVATPGNQDEKDIRKIARTAVRDALREALILFEKD